MASQRESSFISQTMRYHASGGDLDAFVVLEKDGNCRVRIDHHPRGASLLHYAAEKGWCSAIKWLLDRGADVHFSRRSRSWTPLHAAAHLGRCDAAVLLLDAGARVSDRDQLEDTALHLAAGYDELKMCKLLLSRGASLDARDQDGDDPETRARVCDCTTAADLLAAVRAAGGWLPWLDAPRKELLALRQRLPELRDRGRAASSASPRAHEWLFLKAPDGVFSHVLAFWRSPRDA